MIKQWIGLCFGAFACVAIAGCDVDVKDEGELPAVDVDTEEGRMPDVDVRGPDVDVETEKVEVEVPKVKVDIPEENEEVIDAKTED